MATNAKTGKVREVKAREGYEAALKIIREDAAVIIKELMSPDQIRRINEEIQPSMDQMGVGSKVPDDWLKDFHGYNTKRLTGLTTISKTFREDFLDSDFVHQLCEKIFLEDSGTYWLNSAQVIEIGPGSKAQPLHRDQWQYPVFTHCGPSAPEAAINFIIALTEFTDENGATRVIPGSHKWDDFNQNGTEEDTIPIEMNVGDACFLTGKIVHCGGSNRTKDFKRRALSVVIQASYLTPEEAHPFLVKKKIVDTLSPRAQRMVGFRSQFPKQSPGVWKCDYGEMGDALHAWDE
ncbi:hypothetical protein G7Z17_g5855 [Cylindrodendrum hubeiense]|uniref:Phytanoyl-CoA dioxygenase n=1 Tax=Cylindrodendrum hubeiense TaxID=595255 RepID=A0A9P5HC47_9HYPO|nr:hypothetical protein G7Z17_g5855 [Cylindrodendrum hubeiense]